MRVRRDRLFAERARARMLEHPARRFVRLFGRHAHQRFHFRAGEHAPVPRQMVVFLYDFHRLVDAVLLAFNGQPRVVQMRAHLQRIFEQAHVLVESAKERFDLTGNVNGTSHPIGGLCFYGNRVADGGFLLLSIGRCSAFSYRGQLSEKLLTP